MRHRLLVVGAGSIGERHIRCFLATDRASVAFVEPQEALREQTSQKYPNARGFESLEHALDQASFDAAVIATPAPLHAPQAILLLSHGMHLLIEKPLSLDLQSVQELIDLEKRLEWVVAVAYVYRANPLLETLRNEILSQNHGRPIQLVAVAGQHFPTYRPAFRDTYYRRRETGGGAIQDALTHIYNAAEWLVGGVEKIIVDADQLQLDGVEVEDTVHALARHKNNVMASYSLNQHQPANEIQLSIVTDQSMLRWENHNNRVMLYERASSEWSVLNFLRLERDTLFIRQAHAFFDACEKQAPPLCSLDDAVHTLRCNVASLKSLRSKCWEQL